jgi:hypothetical protein
MRNRITDISTWVNDSSIKVKEKGRREAIHILLHAIASSNFLNAHMAMKGGVLLAIKYGSPRYTLDVDFSTSLKASDLEIDLLKQELDKKLILSAEQLRYGMSCLVQTLKHDPKDPNATAPSYKISVGYAYKTDRNNYRRLRKRRSSTALKIDYSFNEIITNPEILHLDQHKSIPIYSYPDLIAEKFRAILQQEQRNRRRSQDVYDIHYLLTNFDKPDDQEKEKILYALKQKSISRNLTVYQDSMGDPEIRKRSEVKYEDLKYDIYEGLPKFDEAYRLIQRFYENLPWKKNL